MWRSGWRSCFKGEALGWYRVTKKVKGRSYLYLQRSFRDGGKVRTESRYIGPADGGNDAGGHSVPILPSMVMGELSPPSLLDIAEPLSPSVITTNERAINRKNLAGLRIRFDIRECQICPERLEREYSRVRGWAQSLGVSHDSFPSIAIRKGSTVRVRKAWLGSYADHPAQRRAQGGSQSLW